MLAFTQENGQVGICQRSTSIPEGLEWIVVLPEDLPDPKYRSSWRVSGNEIVLDADLIEAVLTEEFVKAVNAEATARIIKLFGATSENYLEKQMNALMAATALQEIPVEQRTTEEQTKVTMLLALGVKVKSIRDVSDKAIIDKVALESIVWD
jgi:hypothetical protein